MQNKVSTSEIRFFDRKSAKFLTSFAFLFAITSSQNAVAAQDHNSTRSNKSISVEVDGELFDLTEYLRFTEVPNPGGKPSTSQFELIAGPFGTSLFKVDVMGEMNPDPSIGYSIAITDFGTPSTFNFTFSQAIVPVAGANEVYSTMAGGYTDNSGNGATVTPLAPGAGISVDSDGNTEIHVVNLSEDGGATLVNMGHDLAGPGPYSISSGSGTIGPFTEGWVAGPVAATAWDFMQTNVKFSLSGGGDSAAFTGYAEIRPVPVPAAVWLFGSALGLFGIKRFKK
jgi:hypothetical protein